MSGVTHPVLLSLMGAALRGFDPWGLAVVLSALTCRLFLKYRLTREFELPNPNYALLFARDILSFAGNCPALLRRLCGLEAGDQIGGAGQQGLDEVPALFSGG